MSTHRVFSMALMLFSAANLQAQVPTFKHVTGHDFGESITQHHQMVTYLQALAATSPRVVVRDQGESWEGKRLLLAIVTSPENHARLDQIQRNAQRLGDPRTLAAADAAALIETHPIVVFYGGSVHGFELSGSEGVMKLLQRMTTGDDAATMEVLQNAVLLIDPMLNPDGRDAFAQLNIQNLGRVPTAEPEDWTNDYSGWQGLKFRTGHYYFDTNRDWFAHTQRETRARVATMQDWRPQAVVDMHEMGAAAEFYFDPPGEPFGPYFPEFAKRGFERFGNAYAAAFDSAGFEYMTRERYNFLYPGYTSSYGSYQGAVGMLYEQGSSRGLAGLRGDASVRRLADALEQQYLAAWTAAYTAASDRRELLQSYYDSHQAEIADGRQGVRRYLIAPAGDPSARNELAALLTRGGVEVDVLTQSTRLTGVIDRTGQAVGQQTFPEGTIVVDAAQPRNRLIRSLLEPENTLPEDFLAAARRRVERDENPRFYDITTWSMPLMFDLSGYGSTDGRELATTRWDPSENVSVSSVAVPEYAYLLDGDNAASLAALYHLKAHGFRAAVLWAPTRIAGQDIPGGSVIVRRGQNEPEVDGWVRELAAHYGIELTAVNTGLADPGYPSLGSGDWTFNVEKPEIAILSEEPVSGYSFGWAWYTLDRQYEIPAAVLRTRSLGNDLSRLNVLVIPSVSGAALARTVGEQSIERLKQWVNDGGTLVTIGSATDFARNQLDLLSLRSWYDTEESEGAQAFDVPGAFFRGVIDNGYWLSAGYDGGDIPVLVDSDRLYMPPEGPPSARRRVVVTYAEDGTGTMSGHAWQETLDRIPGMVFAYEERVGGGRVIAFAEDVNYRALWRGANRMFLNAVVLGPSAP